MQFSIEKLSQALDAEYQCKKENLLDRLSEMLKHPKEYGDFFLILDFDRQVLFELLRRSVPEVSDRHELVFLNALIGWYINVFLDDSHCTVKHEKYDVEKGEFVFVEEGEKGSKPTVVWGGDFNERLSSSDFVKLCQEATQREVDWFTSYREIVLIHAGYSDNEIAQVDHKKEFADDEDVFFKVERPDYFN